MMEATSFSIEATSVLKARAMLPSDTEANGLKYCRMALWRMADSKRTVCEWMLRSSLSSAARRSRLLKHDEYLLL